MLIHLTYLIIALWTFLPLPSLSMDLNEYQRLRNQQSVTPIINGEKVAQIMATKQGKVFEFSGIIIGTFGNNGKITGILFKIDDKQTIIVNYAEKDADIRVGKKLYMIAYQAQNIFTPICLAITPFENIITMPPVITDKVAPSSTSFPPVKNTPINITNDRNYAETISSVPPVSYIKYANGTGFIVSSDGYLLTCAHVIEGADKVSVSIGTQIYDAIVLKTDKLYDLALLWINAKNLKTLPLADSDYIEKGQEVRAFGYPLSSILGDDLKVTRGTVSGISMRDMQKNIQIDAAINSGNSGGPLVNEKGEVIGIVNAKIVSVEITNIGFVVPINYAKYIIKEWMELTYKNIPFKLDGPELVKRISPAVVLITAWKTIPPVCKNPKDGAEMVLVPAGEFLMGSSEDNITAFVKSDPDYKKEWYTNEMPQHKVFIDNFYIYKTEVTVAQFRKFCHETGRKNMPPEPWWSVPIFIFNKNVKEIVQDNIFNDKNYNNRPIVDVTWNDAVEYAKWAGATLPTEAQWEKSARGTDERIYPWGNDWDATKYCGNHDYPSVVGNFFKGASPYGCLDMAGNVFEWCSDYYNDWYYKYSLTSNPNGPTVGLERVIRGGSFYNNGFGRGFVRCTARTGSNPLDRNDAIGFRCVVNLPTQ